MVLRMIVAAAVLLAALPANAALYRWIDNRGVVQFSDQPPPKHADGATMSLDVPQPPSGTTPLTKSISQRSQALSKSGTRNTPNRSRSNGAKTARRNTGKTATRSWRRATSGVRASGY